MGRKESILTVVIILLVFGVYIIQQEKKLRISDVKWGYEKGIFKVAFLAQNNTRRELTNRLSIRAFKEKRISNAVSYDDVGEKTIIINLYPGEKKYVNEELKLLLNLNPDRVTVNVINWE